MIQAKIVADSVTDKEHRLPTLEVVMPRYILAEFNTHRMLSKNSASSRAIPFNKMVKEVQERPFIPIAWQKNHPGMQGTEYLSKTDKYNLIGFMSVMIDTLANYPTGTQEFENYSKKVEEKVEIINTLLQEYLHLEKTLDEWWLFARDKSVESASIMYVFDVTKQFANRLLEPFMYHKVLVSGTEWENFFNLRCPSYTFHNDDSDNDFVFKSRKDAIKSLGNQNVYYSKESVPLEDLNLIQWLELNTGQADIHMMFLAEAIWDAMNESTPVLLKEGEWHIPFGDNMDEDILLPKTAYGFEPTNTSVGEKGGWTIEGGEEAYYYILNELKCKISIARCARLSYQTLGDNPVIDYEKDLALYESLSTSGHWSPFEHVAKAMTTNEYFENIKGNSFYQPRENGLGESILHTTLDINDKRIGWCKNYKGFIQYRDLLDI